MRIFICQSEYLGVLEEKVNRKCEELEDREYEILDIRFLPGNDQCFYNMMITFKPDIKENK